MIFLFLPVIILGIAALFDLLEKQDKRDRLRRDEEELNKYLRGISHGRKH